MFGILKSKGIAALFAQTALAIPDNLKEPFFATARDVLYADGQITGEENTYKEIMCKAASIDTARAQARVAVLAAKNRA